MHFADNQKTCATHLGVHRTDILAAMHFANNRKTCAAHRHISYDAFGRYQPIIAAYLWENVLTI
jgi:hypothetical protein